MNRSLWTQTLTEQFCPPWPCPTCKKGVLALVPGSFYFKESVASKRAHGEEGWDPDWVTYNFTCRAQCNNGRCGEEAVLAGVGGIEPEWQEDDVEWVKYFSPHLCRPMPDIIELPSKCPRDVASALRAAFALFWSDRAAAAGRVRVALDYLMDELGIPREKQKGSKTVVYDLHGRIELFANNDPTMGMRLMALKWLGNTGSHQRIVIRDDLLDAFQVLEHSLVELIDKRTANVDALAQKLTRKHAPLRKPRKPSASSPSKD
jgi:hypothetical protein